MVTALDRVPSKMCVDRGAVRTLLIRRWPPVRAKVLVVQPRPTKMEFNHYYSYSPFEVFFASRYCSLSLNLLQKSPHPNAHLYYFGSHELATPLTNMTPLPRRCIASFFHSSLRIVITYPPADCNHIP